MRKGLPHADPADDADNITVKRPLPPLHSLCAMRVQGTLRGHARPNAAPSPQATRKNDHRRASRRKSLPIKRMHKGS
ncbi:MAG: hypothetical protein WC360_08085 [Opitutales bacterium]|jgi:hypothetical protein